MGRRRKLLQHTLSGRSDANIPFEQSRTRELLVRYGLDKEGDA